MTDYFKLDKNGVSPLTEADVTAIGATTDRFRLCAPYAEGMVLSATRVKSFCCTCGRHLIFNPLASSPVRNAKHICAECLTIWMENRVKKG